MNIIFKGNVVGPDSEPCGQCDSQGTCLFKCFFRCFCEYDDPSCTCLWSRL